MKEMSRNFDNDDEDEYADIEESEDKEITESDNSEKNQSIDSEISEIIDLVSGTLITINTFRGKKTFDIGRLFVIDENNLTEEFTTQAASYAFFSTLIAEAERNVAKRDLAKDQEYATADEYYRNEMTAKGEKYTEAVIRSLVLRDEDYLKSSDQLEDAKYELNLIKAIVRSYEQKSTMLQSLGNHLRSEYVMMGMHIDDLQTSKIISDVKNSISKRRNKK